MFWGESYARATLFACHRMPHQLASVKDLLREGQLRQTLLRGDLHL
jgi:hypothetical protein